MFEVEIVTFAPEHRRVRRADLTRDAAADAVRQVEHAPAANVLVGDFQRRVAGDFNFWLGRDRARVRLDLHREWCASDPTIDPTSANGAVTFRDDDGSEFVEPYAATVSRDQALQAFFHWLRTSEMDPTLNWA